MDHIKKALLMGAGFLFAVLGIIGAFTPVLPAIPFFIIASICFSKSSKKFHRILLENKWIGPHVKNYHANGLKFKTKMLFIVVQWAGILLTYIFLVHNFLGRLLMAVITIGVTIFILSLKTDEK